MRPNLPPPLTQRHVRWAHSPAGLRDHLPVTEALGTPEPETPFPNDVTRGTRPLQGPLLEWPQSAAESSTHSSALSAPRP